MLEKDGLDPERDEAERQAIIADLRKAMPGRDVSKLLMGHLAGPADADRPAVPIWEFRAYAARVGINLDDLAHWRYPLEFHGAGSTIVSVADELEEVLPTGIRFTADDVVRRYELLAEAGALSWDVERKAMVETLPREQSVALYEDWLAGVRDA